MLMAEAKVKRSVASKNAEEANHKIVEIKKRMLANMRLEKDGKPTMINKTEYDLLLIDFNQAASELAHYKTEYQDWSMKESTLRLGDKIDRDQKLHGSINNALQRVKKHTEQAIANQDSASDIVTGASDALLDYANNGQISDISPAVEEVSNTDFLRELVRLKQQEQKNIEEKTEDEEEESEEEEEEEIEKEEVKEEVKSMYKSVKKVANVVSS